MSRMLIHNYLLDLENLINTVHWESDCHEEWAKQKTAEIRQLRARLDGCTELAPELQGCARGYITRLK